jgi:hypothetical protein
VSVVVAQPALPNTPLTSAASQQGRALYD